MCSCVTYIVQTCNTLQRTRLYSTEYNHVMLQRLWGTTRIGPSSLRPGILTQTNKRTHTCDTILPPLTLPIQNSGLQPSDNFAAPHTPNPELGFTTLGLTCLVQGEKNNSPIELGDWPRIVFSYWFFTLRLSSIHPAQPAVTALPYAWEHLEQIASVLRYACT
jgi:hypothetical protein